jgi:hypothetical protein
LKVGLAKERGGITFDKDQTDKVIARIKAIYGADAQNYLHIKETPDRQTLNKLTVCELKKLGCEVVADNDKVVIKESVTDLDKYITALLAAATA